MNFAELQPAPPVGFNLTFMCPEGEVCLQKHNLQYKVYKVQTQMCGQIKVLYLLETSNSFIKKIQWMAFSLFI